MVNILELLSDLLNKSLLDLVSSFTAINEPSLHLLKAKWKPWEEAKGHDKTEKTAAVKFQANGPVKKKKKAKKKEKCSFTYLGQFFVFLWKSQSKPEHFPDILHRFCDSSAAESHVSLLAALSTDRDKAKDAERDE